MNYLKYTINRPILCYKCIWFLRYTPINFSEIVLQDTRDSFGTKFKKKAYVQLFKKM